MPHAGSIPKQVPWKNSARLLAKQDNQCGAPLANWDAAHLVRSKEKKMEADCVIFFRCTHKVRDNFRSIFN